MKKDIVLSENKMNYLIMYFEYFKYKIPSLKVFNYKVLLIFLSSKIQMTKYVFIHVTSCVQYFFPVSFHFISHNLISEFICFVLFSLYVWNTY